MTRHVDAETLAGYRDGDLRGWRAWLIRGHLARCAECGGLSADLAQVTTLLASVPEPAMPDDLSARIQTALAHEAALRAGSAAASPAPAGERAAAATAIYRPDSAGSRELAEPAGGGEGDHGPGHGQRDGRQRLPRWWSFRSPGGLRVATAAAALVVLGLGGYEVAVHAGGSSGPSGIAGRRAAVGLPRVRYGPRLQYRHSGQPQSVTAISTDNNFTAAQLSNQVSGLTGHGSSAAAPSTSAGANIPAFSASGATFGNIPVSTMTGCINRIASGAVVILVDVAKFQGTPAMIIVTEASEASQKQIWVVATTCSASVSDILDHVVLPLGS